MKGGRMKSQKKFQLQESPLTLRIQEILGERFGKAQKMWALKEYDWGSFCTSRGEWIDPGRNCTCAILVKFGPQRYTLVFLYRHGIRKPKVVDCQGYPMKVRNPTGRFNIHRSALI
jgi:hypothetical protein